ncbi:hypothetical protein QR680_017402 [Steinernema hermaphroditum]|uniref:Large ribosomal subunit protein uL13 n=1 Tax=Steinernema hermaphroditum TaxID=289476 RepID=A0AA39HGL2_9BILA|nr:hypothetical protein QR680_017402 [Steinernema hermaphroditum]
MVSSKPIVIDAKDHLLGRLASTIAKQLLLGEKVIAVRCEGINISGNFHRSKLKYLAFMRKRCNVNPNHGAFHLRAPGKILRRTVRGMLPHKTPRGEAALNRLTCFEGVPSPYDKVQRLVVPNVVRHIALKPGRKFCSLGRLSHEVGWQYKGVVEKLEAKRKIKSAARYQQKKANLKLHAEAVKAVEAKIAPFQKIIESYGYN